MAAVALAILLLPACEPLSETPGPPVPYVGPASDILYKFLSNVKEQPVRGYKMAAVFVGELPKLQKRGVLFATRILGADGEVSYKMTGFEGDDTVKKDVIARYMTAETKARNEDGNALGVNLSNYTFKYDGIRTYEDRTAYRFEVNPRRKSPGLFKGSILIDAATCLPLREEGRFVASPSVFLKKINFVRDYTLVDGTSIPSFLVSRIQTRFWGEAILQVKYSRIEPLVETTKPIALPTSKSDLRGAASPKSSKKRDAAVPAGNATTAQPAS